MVRSRILRTLCCVTLTLAVVVLAVGCSESEEPDKLKYARYVAQGINDGATPKVPSQSYCPVCNEPIKPQFHDGSKDARVYFCSEECKSKWDADASKYEKGLAKQGEGMDFMGDPYGEEEDQ